ncbi:hypothetical protein [Alkalicoccobacillus plakortidis]|uniref:Phage protein n=1 Tax=Alkalicoccobacillus plakortidis TaxID=444060 RepID=A0ABT0XI26_9BACI|nr:hypothetical protein [Alkalicoccobacillus plakortidis]MCM2675548.1 hypothetical protein [Alkalicoccobacillus plakortidis]
MAIKIDLKRPIIEVEINGLQFEYDYSDSNLKKELEVGENALKKVAELDDQNGFDDAKDTLREAYDVYLGAGSFDQIYTLNPSIIELGVGYVSLRTGLMEELEKRGEFKGLKQSKSQKYIQSKKK